MVTDHTVVEGEVLAGPSFLCDGHLRVRIRHRHRQ